MFSFKPTKPHNMVALMLDPQFKDLSLVVDYVGHSFAIEIVVAYHKEFLLPTLKTLYQKYHGQSSTPSIVVQELMYNLVFGVGVYEEDTCFEQVSLNSFTSLETL
jgi:hypothetical protein